MLYHFFRAARSRDIRAPTLYDLFGNVYDDTKVGPPPPGESRSSSSGSAWKRCSRRSVRA